VRSEFSCGLSIYCVAGLFEHRSQQYITARLNMLWPGILDFVMTNTVFARNENHCSRRDTGEVYRVVPRAADNVQGGQAKRFAGPANRVYQVIVKRLRGKIYNLLDFHTHTTFVL